MTDTRDPGQDAPVDRARLRGLVVDANDGIIATAGVVEGFLGAGADRTTLLIAAFASMLAGGVALGAAKYGEYAAERDAQLALIEEERRQLELSPTEELAELAAFYEEKGLEPVLAKKVAEALSERDALAAHVEAEHGIDLAEGSVRPVISSVLSGVMFAIGSTFAVMMILVMARRLLVAGMFVGITAALALTSWITSRWGQVPFGRTLVRNLSIGLTAMAITFFVGSLFSV